jgi:hypothetical protein
MMLSPTGMNVLRLHSMDVDDKYHSDVKRGYAMDDHLQIHGEKDSGDAHIAHVHVHHPTWITWTLH